MTIFELYYQFVCRPFIFVCMESLDISFDAALQKAFKALNDLVEPYGLLLALSAYGPLHRLGCRLTSHRNQEFYARKPFAKPQPKCPNILPTAKTVPP